MFTQYFYHLRMGEVPPFCKNFESHVELADPFVKLYFFLPATENCNGGFIFLHFLKLVLAHQSQQNQELTQNQFLLLQQRHLKQEAQILLIVGDLVLWHPRYYITTRLSIQVLVV